MHCINANAKKVCKCLKCLLSKYNDKKHRYKTVKCRALEYEVKALKVRRHLDVSNKLYENYNYSSNQERDV